MRHLERLLVCLTLTIFSESAALGVEIQDQAGFDLHNLLEARPHRAFSTDAWRYPDKRRSVTWDLLHGDLILGKKQDEVRKLLGPPLERQKGEYWNLPSSADVYEISVKRCGNGEYLAILNENGIAKAFQVIQVDASTTPWSVRSSEEYKEPLK